MICCGVHSNRAYIRVRIRFVFGFVFGSYSVRIRIWVRIPISNHIQTLVLLLLLLCKTYKTQKKIIVIFYIMCNFTMLIFLQVSFSNVFANLKCGSFNNSIKKLTYTKIFEYLLLQYWIFFK